MIIDGLLERVDVDPQIPAASEMSAKPVVVFSQSQRVICCLPLTASRRLRDFCRSLTRGGTRPVANSTSAILPHSDKKQKTEEKTGKFRLCRPCPCNFSSLNLLAHPNNPPFLRAAAVSWSHGHVGSETSGDSPLLLPIISFCPSYCSKASHPADPCNWHLLRSNHDIITPFGIMPWPPIVLSPDSNRSHTTCGQETTNRPRLHSDGTEYPAVTHTGRSFSFGLGKGHIWRREKARVIDTLLMAAVSITMLISDDKNCHDSILAHAHYGPVIHGPAKHRAPNHVS